ncbi:MAG TPA: Rrf2 family transcriptional regulator [Polyangiaceae bacterium]|nr:Rrf2 family transcriptional regulator [Polyangiaceae bacterium]
MKLSNKGRYGVRALFDIAFHNDGRPTQIKDIAAREAIPARFLEQIFQDLKRAGLVGAKRGPRGGYHLARPAREIRLGDVVRALEGPIAITGRTEETKREPAPPADGKDVTDAVFRELSHRIEGCFDAVTIADMCRRGDELGLRKQHDSYSYVI